MPLSGTLYRRRWWVIAVVVASTVALVALKVRGRSEVSKAQWNAIRIAVEQRKWGEAERGLERWLKQAPGDGSAWIKLGAVRGVQNRDEEALDAFQRVDATDPAWAQAQTLIGEIWFRRHKAAEAEDAFWASALSNPKAVEPRARLAYLLSLEERPEEARAVIWELYRLTNDPRHLLTLSALSSLDADADPRSLEPELDRFLNASPDDLWLRRARGLMDLRQGRPAAALPHLEAIAGRDDDPIARFALVDCQIALGKMDGIEALLGPAPQSPKDRVQWWLRKGEIDSARGEKDKALDCWRAAVADDPQDRLAQYRLGQELARRGQSELARSHLERASAISGHQARLQSLLSQLGNGNQGPNPVEIYRALGKACEGIGLAAEARAWYLLILKLNPIDRDVDSALTRLGQISEPPRAVRRHSAATVALAKPIGRPSDRPNGPRFDDIASTAGLDFRYESGERKDLFIANTMGGGVGMIDYDGDGWLDLYFVNGCRLPVDPANPPAPNRLYRNRRDGTFEDVTTRAGVGGRGYGMGCAVADYDGDGHDDLYVTGFRSAVLYRNQGDGTFEDVTARAGVGSTRWSTAAGFADLDADSDLDLVVVTYLEADPSQVEPCRDATGHTMHCAPGKYPAEIDHLFRNNGDGTFTDVATEAGFDVPEGYGLGLAIADLDGDGKLDIFVANDAKPNFLFINRGTLRFEEAGVISGLAYDGSGKATASMGVVADDLDGDGLIDIFHTNFLNEPDTFARNLGGGQFADVTAQSGLDAPSRQVTGFGTVALDADNDGRLDLFVVNGHVDDQPWFGRPMAQLSSFFKSVAPGRFELTDPGSTGPYFSQPVVGRGVASGDLDNDGRTDIVVMLRDAPAVVLHNATPDAGHFLGLKLRGTASASFPVGARVTCRVGSKTMVRWVTSGTSYLASSDPRLWFGLGTSRVVDDLEIRWPSGAVQKWSALAADRILDIREGQEPVGLK